jgi:hypothetical protein
VTTDWLSNQVVPTDSVQVVTVTGTCVLQITGTWVEILKKDSAQHNSTNRKGS